MHILRDTNLPADRRSFDFLAGRQDRLNGFMPMLFRDMDPAYRSLPVTDRGLGPANLTLVQKAARMVLLVDTREQEMGPDIGEMISQNKSIAKKSAQAQYPVLLSSLVYNQQKSIAKPRKATALQRLCCPQHEDSLWLSSPPNNPSQVLNNDILMIAIWLRYGQDRLIAR